VNPAQKAEIILPNNPSKKKLSVSKSLAKYGIYLALFVLCAVLSIISPAFLSAENLLNVLRQVSINGMIAVGMTFVIITGGIDLSVGSVMALSAVVATSLAHPNTYPVIVPVLVGLLVGLLCGGINGLLIARWKVAPFIVTLGMMTAARGLTLVYTNGRPINNLSDAYNQIGGGYVAGIPIPVIVLVGIIAIGIFVLNFMKFGRHVYALGGNEAAAKSSGLNINFIKIGVYSIVGITAGLAGVVLSSRVMAGSPVLGQGYELDAIAAVVIGGTSLFGGVGSVAGTIVGALIIGVMNNGLDLLNVSSYYQQVVKGVIIILAVLLDRKNH
jgi:ribose/xylose/arabinose/galactoside ABC-type transport system permease subunit